MAEYPDIIISKEDIVAKFIIDNIDDTEIKKSDIHGLGLFATKDIASGEILCILDGQLVSWESYDYMSEKHPFGKYNNYLFMEWNAINEHTLMIRPFRTKYSFINHSKNPNLTMRRYPITLMAMKNIKSGEELTLDYRKEPLSEKYLNNAKYLEL